jgi:hypothetical protein
MKNSLLLLAVLSLAVATAYGQYGQPSGSKAQTAEKSTTANPPLKDINGTISEDGKSFTSDKGKDTWTLKNPEDVKGHEGHHVKLNAHVYKDSKELHVMKVTMLPDKSAQK